MNEIDNIELRSEKIRNILGQIPPRIIRIGTTLLFLIIVVLLSILFFFKYEYTIKTTALIEQQSDATIIEIRIPANEIDKVSLGCKVVLNFDNIPNLFNKKIETIIETIPNKIEISENGGFYISVHKLMLKLKTVTGEDIIISSQTLVNAEIITDKISFFDRIIKPFKTLFNEKK